MPIVRPKSKVAAFAVSDIHLDHIPPIARSAEPDWYAAQRRYLRKLWELYQRAPIFCAGDIFNRWDAKAELINFALKELPPMYAVPGQHDLPGHSYKDIKRSAFHTLVEAGKITLVEPMSPIDVPGHRPIRLWGFPYGFDPKPIKGSMCLEVALIHRFIWIKGKAYKQAPENRRVGTYSKMLSGFDVAIFGDNHIPFDYKMKSGCRVVNCGTFMRRRIDERNLQPTVTTIYNNGDTKRLPLDIQDKYITDKQIAAIEAIEAEGLFNELRALSDSAIDFAAAVMLFLETNVVSEAVKSFMLEAIGVNK